MVPRNIRSSLHRDLQRKFVFLSGPRQVGKTTLAQELMRDLGGTYLSYDDPDDRRTILERHYVGSPWVCLDEFHKYPRWKNHLKGVYDKHHSRLHVLVTGSARLDLFQRSGDSLLGRYYRYRIHPLSLGELASTRLPPVFETPPDPPPPLPMLPELLRFGGFPEPFVRQSEQEHRRWCNLRRQLIVREELRELTHVHLLGLVEHLLLLIPRRVGSPLSFRSLAEDLQVAVPTVQNWMRILEQLYAVFPLRPYAARITRSLRQMPKYYLYDWSELEDEGARFENLVASHLLKAAHLWTDAGDADVELRYLRDREHREVDFLMLRDGRPWFLLESKLADSQVSESLRTFANRLAVPGIQLLARGGTCRREGNLWVVSADRWLGLLP